MNSNFGKSSSNSQRGSVSLNNYEFDLGLGSNRPRSLNDQKQNPTSSYSSFSLTQSKPTTSSWQPNKPSWSHQPAPTQSTRPGLTSTPTSMVGDISGKSWGSTAPSRPTAGIGIGIVDKNPNLFGDLIGSALGQNKSNSNVPLKNAAPAPASAPAKSAYSMGNLADSLPKTSNSVKSSGNWGSSGNFGSFSGTYNSSNNINKSPNLGGPSMRSVGVGVGGGGMSSNKDPFGSLVDFGSKPSGNPNLATKGDTKVDNIEDFTFGDFRNASKSSTPAFSSNAFPGNNSNSMGSGAAFDLKMDNFGFPTKDFVSQNLPTGVDPLDMLFSSSSASAGAAPIASEGLGSQQFSEVDDWGMDSEFGGGNDTGTTTELEGLPPPPAGVTASAAKNKGMDNYKQGQFADAIKWLSWAVILLEKAGDDVVSMEVLSCRASCYKEVGEYKKAVADCTKVLEQDDTSVPALVQRALLYESMEKYKLGAEDLRTVLKLDPSNRLARSTIHRLIKLAD